MLEAITDIVEGVMGVAVDREGFGFARFATHVQYLLQRVSSDENIASANSDLYAAAAADHPAASACVEAIAAVLKRSYPHELTDEEKLYLMLHINRICTRSDAGGASAEPGA